LQNVQVFEKVGKWKLLVYWYGLGGLVLAGHMIVTYGSYLFQDYVGLILK